MTELTEYIEVYKPSEILGMFQSFLARQNEAAKVVFIKGVYFKSPKNNIQWAFCYDIIRDEDKQEEITIKLTSKQREELKDGNLVMVGGIIGRQIKQNGFIQLILSVSRVEIMQEQIVSENELKMIELRKLKSMKGFRNVDTLLEDKLYSGERPLIALLFASTSITMSDFNAGKNTASSHIDFTEHRVSFGNAVELSNYLQKLDSEHYDAIALIRGGGGGIESLDDLAVLEKIVNLKTAFICAVGHVDEKLFIKNLADKVAPTPNGLGSYFSEMVENVIQKKNKSRAVLVEQVKKQFKEQIDTANKQNKDLQEKISVLTRNNEANQKMHTEQIRNAEKQNKNLQEQLSILSKNTAIGQKSHKEQTEAMQKQLTLMQGELKSLKDINEKQAKEFNENISYMQLTNQKLQTALDKLNTENTQTMKNFTEAKMYAKQLEQQLADKQKKTGCLNGFILIAIVIVVLSLILV